MSALHLTHMIPWKDLLDYHTVNDDPSLIKMPIGECGLIHIIDKTTRLQVDGRKYLADHICTTPDCKYTGSTKAFGKTLKKKLRMPDKELIPVFYEGVDYASSIRRFMDGFCQAIREFSDTERKKVQRKILEPESRSNSYYDQISERLKKEGKWSDELEGKNWHNCECSLFTVLMESGDSEILLSFHDDTIKHVLHCNRTQAVGHNLGFLKYNVINAYMYTNFIVAAGLHDQPDQWGFMKSDQYWRRSLMDDCDAQSFLVHSRKYLTDELYLKDWEAMKELCKICFRFLYIVDMLHKEVEGDKWDITKTKECMFGFM